MFFLYDVCRCHQLEQHVTAARKSLMKVQRLHVKITEPTKMRCFKILSTHLCGLLLQRPSPQIPCFHKKKFTVICVCNTHSFLFFSFLLLRTISQCPYVISLEIFGEGVNFPFYENILFTCFKNQCLHFFQCIYKVAVVRFK